MKAEFRDVNAITLIPESRLEEIVMDGWKERKAFIAVCGHKENRLTSIHIQFVEIEKNVEPSE